MSLKEIHAKGPLPRIVVVGGGFGGMQVVKGLRDSRAEIVLIDRVMRASTKPFFSQIPD